ncbi:hypothetical protein [Halalkalicoccus jeotgali]|nr:hypothetical protein [Halalkalicoccus jeotgali]
MGEPAPLLHRRRRGGVETVPAGVGELARLQAADWAPSKVPETGA